jgi:hypothetical protein
VCDFLLDLTQNAVEAGSSHITIQLAQDETVLTATVVDNGRGMDATTLAKFRDPFFSDGTKHPGRKTGLGIPFLVQALDQAGGHHEVSSAPGIGTRFSFAFPRNHLDTPQLGDLPGFFLSALCFDGEYELCIERKDWQHGLDYTLNRSDLLDAVGSLHDAHSMLLVRQFLESQEALAEPAHQATITLADGIAGPAEGENLVWQR